MSLARGLLGRLGWLAAGTLLTLGLLEAGLRLAGLAARPRPGPAPPGAKVVLCEGDSFTYGLGGVSYPLQLQKILDARAGAGRYYVVNHGVPSSSSSQVAERVEVAVPRLRPDYLLVVTGEHYSWNLMGRDFAAFSRWAALDEGLMRSHAYRLFKLLLLGLRHADPLSAGWQAGDRGHRMQDAGWEVELDGTHGIAWMKLPSVRLAARDAASLRRRGDLKGALAKALGGLELCYALDDREHVVILTEKDLRGLGGVVEAAAKAFPDDESAGFARAEYLERTGRLDEAEAAFKGLAGRSPASGRSRAGLAMCRLERLDADGAARELSTALDLAPMDFKVRMAAARMRLFVMDYVGAARELDRIQGPGREIVASLTAQLFGRGGEFERSLALFQAIGEHDWTIADYAVQADLLAYYRDGGEEGRRKSIELLERGLRRYPRTKMFDYLLRRLPDPASALGYARDIPELKENPSYRRLERLAALSRRQGRGMTALLSDALRRDLRRIHRTSELGGSRLILASYPQWDLPELKETAAGFGVAFLDFHELFLARFKDRKEWVSTDNCHCNSEGYRTMAETFAGAILGDERPR